MNIVIKRSFFWHDLKVQAVCLKRDIERELGIPVQIKKGGPGSLNVFANGKKIFAYQESHRHPQAAEIISTIRTLATNH